MKRRLYITKAHTVLEILSYVFIVASFALAIYGINTLPDEIPTHFDFQGNIDGYGSPGSLLLLPIIMLITLGTVSLITHFVSPQFYNMPFKIKPGRELIIYKDVVWMMVGIEFMISLFTLAAVWSQFISSGTIIMIASIGLCVGIFALIIGVLIVMFRHNR